MVNARVLVPCYVNGLSTLIKKTKAKQNNKKRTTKKKTKNIFPL